jgi:hypothetical protein
VGGRSLKRQGGGRGKVFVLGGGGCGMCGIERNAGVRWLAQKGGSGVGRVIAMASTLHQGGV